MKICSVCSTCFEDSEEFCFDPDHGELSDGPHSVDSVTGYRIGRLITSSPKAVLYEAQQIDYGQDCLISIADEAPEQFLSDAKIAASLFHPGVAGVVESGELSNGSAFAVFEGSAASSLRHILSEASLSLLDRIKIARQTAEAIHAIHSAGILHGALRPENISIDGIGTDQLSVKVHNIDLGSSFANGMLSNRFSMDSSLDSLRYFPPERFRGEASTVRSDVYSLGILLYELLSGHPPFEASSAAALADMHLNQKPPEIKIENFDLRMLLTHTITESLQKQPSFRQSTADLFARQMRHIEQLATHVSTPPPAVAVAAVASSLNRPLSTPYVRPEPQPVPIPPVEVAAPVAPEVLVEKADPVAAMESPIEVFVEQHAVPVTTPVAYVPTPTKRSRLKVMKKRLQGHISDAKDALRPTPTVIDWHPPVHASSDAKEVLSPTTLIDWDQPDDDIPSIAVREELANSGATVPFDAEDEITHVRRPAGRIEVNWDESKNSERRPFALAFLPTLLSRREAGVTDITDDDDSGFSAYQSHGRDLGKLPIYAVVLCGLLIVAFGIVRIGSALAEDNGGYIGEARPAPIQIQAHAVKPAPIEPQMAVMNIPAQQIDMPAAVSTNEDEVVDVKANAVEESKPPAMDPPKRTKSEPVKSEAAKIVAVQISRPSKKESPLVPSTLVITRGTAKPRAVIVAGTAATRTTNPGTGATRPRIVGLPD